MSSWHSYGKIYNVGHSYVKNIFFDDVLVEEKVDGSQFSFGLIDGQLMVRSKGVVMDIEHPEKMFNKAIETVRELKDKLTPGWTYRGEFLAKPKHNTLAYDRTPNGFVILFDIATEEECYLPYAAKAEEAARLNLEVVPKIFEGKITSSSELLGLMDRVSILGGSKIEGLVIKNYKQFGPDKKVLLAKHVSEGFKEIHNKDWKVRNPAQTDVIDTLVESLRTPARYEKGIQHLRERGELTNTPKDIGALVQEVQQDVLAEETEYIKQKLFEWAKAKIVRGVTNGLPQYYKEKLLKSNFDE